MLWTSWNENEKFVDNHQQCFASSQNSNFHKYMLNLIPWNLGMPCPFTKCKMFCAGPNVFGQTKNWIEFYCPSKVLCWHKNWIYCMKIILWSSTKLLGLAQYVNQCLIWQKKFGPAQKQDWAVSFTNLLLQFKRHKIFL